MHSDKMEGESSSNHFKVAGQRILKLKGSSNYDEWADAVKNAFELEDYENTLLESTDENYEKDAKKLKRARCYLLAGVEPCVKNHIKELTSATEIWAHLKKLFDGVGMMMSEKYSTLIHTLNMEDCENLQEYINKMKGAANKLAALGEPMGDKQFCTQLRRGLPSSYRPIILTFDVVGGNFTSDQVMAKLLQYDETTLGSDYRQAMLSKQSRSSNNRNNVNHRGNPSGNGANPDSVCWRCEQVGHFRHQCPNRDKKDIKDKKDKSGKKTLVFINKICLSGDMSDDVDGGEDSFYVDSGCANHVTGSKKWLKNRKKGKFGFSITADGKSLPITCKGDVTLKTADGQRIEVKDCMYVPGMKYNLLSVKQIVDRGFKVDFDGSTGCTVYDRDGTSVLNVLPESGTYKLKVAAKSEEKMLLMSGILNFDEKSSDHTHTEKAENVAEGVEFHGVAAIAKSCDERMEKRSEVALQLAKRTSAPLEIIHAELCKMSTESIGGAKYLLILVDDFSCMYFPMFLREKSDDAVLECLKRFIADAKKKTKKRLKRIVMDDKPWFNNAKMKAFIEESGIEQKFGNTFESNRPLVKTLKEMLVFSKLPGKCWAEAANYGAWLLNTEICSSHGKIPFELFYKKKADDLSDLPRFGEKIKKSNRVFVGYDGDSKSLRLLDLKNGTLKFVKEVNVRQISKVTAGDGYDEELEVRPVAIDNGKIVSITSSSSSDDDSSDAELSGEEVPDENEEGTKERDVDPNSKVPSTEEVSGNTKKTAETEEVSGNEKKTAETEEVSESSDDSQEVSKNQTVIEIIDSSPEVPKESAAEGSKKSNSDDTSREAVDANEPIGDKALKVVKSPIKGKKNAHKSRAWQLHANLAIFEDINCGKLTPKTPFKTPKDRAKVLDSSQRDERKRSRKKKFNFLARENRLTPVNRKPKNFKALTTKVNLLTKSFSHTGQVELKLSSSKPEVRLNGVVSSTLKDGIGAHHEDKNCSAPPGSFGGARVKHRAKTSSAALTSTGSFHTISI